MIELVVLGGLMAAGLAVASVIGVFFLVFKVLMWTVFLPFRLLFKLLMIPVWLTMGAVGLAAGAAVIPVVVTVGLGILAIGAVLALLALLVPAIPFVLFGLLIWAFVRSRPATA